MIVLHYPEEHSTSNVMVDVTHSQTQLLQWKFILGGLVVRRFLLRLCLDRPITTKGNLNICPLINRKYYQRNHFRSSL